MKKTRLRSRTCVMSPRMPYCRERKLDRLGRRLRTHRAFRRPAGLEHDHGPAEREGEADLRERSVAPADGDHRVARPNDCEVARVADPGDHDVVDPIVEPVA